MSRHPARSRPYFTDDDRITLEEQRKSVLGGYEPRGVLGGGGHGGMSWFEDALRTKLGARRGEIIERREVLRPRLRDAYSDEIARELTELDEEEERIRRLACAVHLEHKSDALTYQVFTIEGVVLELFDLLLRPNKTRSRE